MNESNKMLLILLAGCIALLLTVAIIKLQPYEMTTSAGTKVLVVPCFLDVHYVLDDEGRIYKVPTDIGG